MPRIPGWTAQAILVCCVALGVVAAVEEVEITSLRWYTEGPDMLLCADTALASGEIRLLVYTEGIGQSDYVGSLSDDNCATFSVYSPYSGLTNTFGLLVVNEADEIIQQGETIFTLTAEEFLCGGAWFARFTSGSINSSTDAWACLPDLSVCYCEAPAEVCIGGLDPSNNPELMVCVPTNFINATETVEDYLEAKSLTYSFENGTGILEIDHSSLPSFRLAELLSRADNEFSLTVGSCANDLCTLDPFSPSTSNYSLCGVYLGQSSNSVVGVGATTFQDFMLTVDETDVPIIFHIVKIPNQQLYEIYHGDRADSVLDGSRVNLDCSEVPSNSFCYGVVNEESAYVAVSYTNKSNAIVSPVAVVGSSMLVAGEEYQEEPVLDSEVELTMDSKPGDLADEKPAVRLHTKIVATKEEIDSGYERKFAKALKVQNPRITGKFPSGY